MNPLGTGFPVVPRDRQIAGGGHSLLAARKGGHGMSGAKMVRGCLTRQLRQGRGVDKVGLSRESHKLQVGGSNPPSATSFDKGA